MCRFQTLSCIDDITDAVDETCDLITFKFHIQNETNFLHKEPNATRNGVPGVISSLQLAHLLGASGAKNRDYDER